MLFIISLFLCMIGYEVNLSYLRNACYEKHEAKKNKMSKERTERGEN